MTLRIDRRHVVGGLGAALAAVPLAGPSFLHAQEPPIRIGVVLPMSGPLHQFGTQDRVGIELALSEINAAGGVLGRTIDAAFIDDRTDPQMAAAEAAKLIADQSILAIIGPVSSASRNAMMPAIQQAGMPLLYATNYEGGGCAPTAFFFSTVPNQNADPLMHYLMLVRGLKRFFLLGADYAWPRGMFAAAKASVAAGGGAVLGERYVPLAPVSDYGPLIAEIAKSGAQALVLALPGDAHVAFLRQARRSGLLQVVTVADLAQLQIYLKRFRPVAGERMFACVSFVATDQAPSVRSFVARAMTIGGADFTVTPGVFTHFNAVHALKAAIERSGQATRAGVVAGLKGLTIDTPTGRLSLGPDHHATMNMFISEARNGTVVLTQSLGPIAPEPQCAGGSG